MRDHGRVQAGILMVFHPYPKNRLLAWKGTRTEAVGRLLEVSKRQSVPVLGYVVLPDTVAVLAVPDSLRTAGAIISHIRGTLSRSYARRKGLDGPFWKGSAGYTLVQGRQALCDCLLALATAPVAEERVLHPCEYRWSSYRELVGLRRRYRILDHRRLKELYACEDDSALQARIAALAEGAGGNHRPTVADWSRPAAVGDKPWVQAARNSIAGLTAAVAPFATQDGERELAALNVPERDRRYHVRRLLEPTRRTSRKRAN